MNSIPQTRLNNAIVFRLTQRLPAETTGVYPLERNSDILQFSQISSWFFDVHAWGVSVRLDVVPAKPVLPPHDTRKITHMSMTTKKRIIKYTSMLEFFGAEPTHLLTLTLPASRFERLSDEDKVKTWVYAKAYFFKALQKKLAREVPDYGYFASQEFQTRGAPHLHLLIKLFKMSKRTWRRWLRWFVKEWKKALKWSEKIDGKYPSQGVDFQKLRYKDFRYARAYMTKNEQKEAPFEANWGRWWSVAGTFRLKNVSKQYDFKLSPEEQTQLNAIIGNYHFLTWSKIKQCDPILHEELMQRLQKERWIHDDTIHAKKYKRVFTREELQTMRDIYFFEMEMNEELLE